jgi:hypothetical protein
MRANSELKIAAAASMDETRGLAKSYVRSTLDENEAKSR